MFGRKAIAISAVGRSDTRPVLDAKSANSGTDIADKKSADAKVERAAKVDTALIVFGRDDKGKAHASRFGEDARSAAMKAAHRMGFVALAVTKDAMRNIAEGLPEGRVFESGKAFVPFVKEGTCLALEGHAKQFPRDVLELSSNQIAEIEAEAAKTKEVADKPDDDNQSQSDNQSAGSDEPNQATGNDSGQASNAKDATEIDMSEDHGDDDIPAKSDPPAGWLNVEIGTIVLAVDDPDDGWWEAKVTHAHKSGIGTNTITMLTLEWVAYPDEPSFVRRANEVAYFPAGYRQNSPQAGGVGESS